MDDLATPKTDRLTIQAHTDLARAHAGLAALGKASRRDQPKAAVAA